MKVSDLVKHKHTQAIGMIMRVPKNIEFDCWYDVEWYDGCNQHCGSHLEGELAPIDEKAP